MSKAETCENCGRDLPETEVCEHCGHNNHWLQLAGSARKRILKEMEIERIQKQPVTKEHNE